MQKVKMKIFLIGCFCGIIGSPQAQTAKWWDDLSDSADFHQIQNAYEAARGKGKLSSQEMKFYGRWRHFMEPRVLPSGEPFNPDNLWNAYHSYFHEKNTLPQGLLKSQLPSWQYIGPSSVPMNGNGSSTPPGAGRVNCIEVNPENQDEYWVGTPHGGLWHSMNGGSTWQSVTDYLPNLGVTDIAIDPRDTNLVYIATGDGFGYNFSGEFWGGTYSIGVMKSLDGGNTWDTTGLNYAASQVHQVYRLIIHPQKPDTLFATTNIGVFRSVDQGNNWNQVLSGTIVKDIEVDPNEPNILYCASNSTIYRSTNGGSTWNSVFGPISADYITMAISNASPDEILAYIDGSGFYLSLDNGSNWNNINSSPSLNTYGWYTSALEASPSVPGKYYFGGINIHSSTNSGANWSQVTYSGGSSSSVVHPDHRDFEIVPGTNTIIDANDGGVYKSNDGGASWMDISDGLEILQIYDMDVSTQDPYFIVAGAQDNSTNLLKGGVWKRMGYGDGTGCSIHPDNSDTIYISYQYGECYESFDGGNSFNWVGSITNAPFVTLLEYGQGVDPLLYSGGYDLKAALADSVLGSTNGGGQIRSINFSKYNNEMVYFTKTSGVFKADLTGAIPSVTNISPGNIVFQAVPTDITTHPYDPDKIWVTFSGFVNGEKVFYSQDGGNNWSNISGSLPNIPFNTIALDDQDTLYNSLYIGSDMGVFYKNDTMSDWISYMQDLPKVLVYDLEIHYGADMIRAATFGRGIWEASLLSNPITRVEPNDREMFSAYSNIETYPNPTSGKVLIKSSSDQINIKGWKVFSISGKVVSEKNLSKENYKTSLDLSFLPKGTYFLKVITNQGNVVKAISVSN